jgi:NADPH-dependent curcumin reductase
MKNTQIRIRQLPSGMPTPDDFELVETPAPTVSAGQILCRARWLSLDPHVAPFLNGRAVLPSRAVADVIESRNDVFGVGATVELEHGLQTLSVSDGSHVHAVRPAQNPASTALGILGVPGMIAYFGLTDAARLQPRETVLVSAAAGAAGAMAGQIARLRGARAIGVDNTKAKCEWVTKTARFHACIDLHAEDLGARLRALAPHGVDVCFDDTLHGEIVKLLVSGRHLAGNARIVRRARQGGPSVSPVDGSGKVLSIDATAYASRREEFLRAAMAWYGEGLLVYREDVVEGLHNAPAHFCRLMRGENFGKPLVKVSPGV